MANPDWPLIVVVGILAVAALAMATAALSAARDLSDSMHARRRSDERLWATACAVFRKHSEWCAVANRRIDALERRVGGDVPGCGFSLPDELEFGGPDHEDN